MLGSALDRLFRHPDRPFATGDAVALSDLRIEIVEVTPDGWPREIRCAFDAESLEALDARWAVWTPVGYAPFPLPAIGETRQLMVRRRSGRL